MDKEFAKQVLAVPTVSRREDMMVEFIEQWCKDNGVECQKDGKKNLYLKKGSAQFFPCVTSHIDTVHHDQEEWIDRHEMLPIEEKGDKLYIPHGPNGQQTGVGADCKAGVAICLAIIAKQPNIKACFFVEEEIGMQGSASLDEAWFNDVAYVIGFDSPESNRAAKACSGTLLFDDKFFHDNIEAVASQHGVTQFKYEPYTDVLNIRKKTEIACMNFGNGGWHPHQKSEYVMFSQMCNAEELGNALIDTIPLDKQYKIPVNQKPAWGFDDDDDGSWLSQLYGIRRSQAQAQPARSSLADYAEKMGQEKLRREGFDGRDEEVVEPDEFDASWDIDDPEYDPSKGLYGGEPTDAELDKIEKEQTAAQEVVVNPGFKNEDQIRDFFAWLNSKK